MAEMGRREALGLFGGGMLAVGVGLPPALAAPKNRLNVTSASGKLNSYIRMRGAIDERLVISYISGSYFGVVDAEVTPLWDVIGATFARYRRRADGGYDCFTGEIAHFLDPKTGEAPGKFYNPYTKKMVTDPQTNLPPTRFAILPDLMFEFAHMPPGMVSDHYVRDPEVRGDDIWFNEVTRTTMPLPGVAKAFHYGETVTMHASVSDLIRRDMKRVPTECSFTNFVDWRPWMEMAGHPGHLTAVGSGRFGVQMSDLPEKWTRATRAKYPHILENPATLLDSVYRTS